MGKELVFVTRNKHKLEEVANKLGSDIRILSLDDVGFEGEIPETADTLEENALMKARFFHSKTGMDCFADDTGLEVEALNGQPGVRSARFASDHDFHKNMMKVLELMRGKTNRKARFRTVIALILDGREFLFEGVVNGTITTEPRGKGGFGYDPIFLPDGYDKTFAQMSLEEKNAISHRARAVEKLVEFLKKHFSEA